MDKTALLWAMLANNTYRYIIIIIERGPLNNPSQLICGYSSAIRNHNESAARFPELKLMAGT